MKKQKDFENNKNYYIGLDIGTDSVGYAVTDESYSPLKHGGEPMMGTHLVDAAEDNLSRRVNRCARRRLDRRQQRVGFIREILAKEICEKDPDFFKRLDSSALFAEDKLTLSKNSFFNDEDYTDANYHREYPTIHHLICALINGSAKQDIRLLYLAIAYLVAHRGHFLNGADKDNVSAVLDFHCIYDEFHSYFETPIWECDVDEFSNILKKKIGISSKEKELKGLAFKDLKYKVTEDDDVNKALIIKLLAGGKVKLEDLFLDSAYADIPSLSLCMNDEEFNAIVSELGDDGELLVIMKKMYDWSILTELAPNGLMISEKKVLDYEVHKKDLAFLKRFVRKYLPQKDKDDLTAYHKIFRSSSIPDNYVAYSYNVKNADSSSVKKKANKESFCSFVLNIVKNIEVDESDREMYDDMIHRLDKDILSFMPKQVDGDNRVIPYQLYYTELVKILERAEKWLPVLTVADESGITPSEKILDTFMYRIPYYVGPLNKHSSKYAWVVRGKERITPWNFNNVVDLDESEEAFIRKMTNKCTYLPGEDVLPKNSLLYTKFEVLNEINNIKINDRKIDIETKKQIYNEIFKKHTGVTLKRIKNALLSMGKIEATDTVSGVDITVKSSLKSYIFFEKYIEAGTLTEVDVEDILNRKAYSEDALRFRRWLSKKHPGLSAQDAKVISNKKFKEFGRLSKMFLSGLQGVNKKTGEVYTIIEALWETNYNLMQLLSDEFTFIDNINNYVAEYYGQGSERTLAERIDEMYVPNAVKRPIIRTLDILNDIVKVEKCPPSKIFIEMSRGGTEDQKNKRTISRRTQITDLYKAMAGSDELSELKTQLEGKTDRELQSEKLFLYFIQLGKCMYTGESINIDNLSSGEYNVDHIYPQSLIKDDSVINNKVLVISEENSRKSNDIVSEKVRTKMYGFWKMLKEKNLISDEKFKRLTRSTHFTEDEKWGFINRQLVETRQSTKAVASLLKEIYPDTEVVYVKAGLVSEFRDEYDLLKSRSVNDLHHAKDAYLNIVVGNVYNSVFTKKWFDPMVNEYSIKVKSIFGRTQRSGDVEVWKGKESIEYVKKTVSKNNIHLTKYPICKHSGQNGGLFDQNPLKAGKNDSLIPRKKELDPHKYGGYNKATTSFFILVKCVIKNKKELIFMPVDLMWAEKFMNDKNYAMEYSVSTISGIANAAPSNIEFPFGMRKIKINTVIELDGFRLFISGKASGGTRMVYSSITSLIISGTWERYVKRLEKFDEKLKKYPNLHVDQKHDKITSYENIELYDIYCQKSVSPLFAKALCSSISETLEKGRDKFISLSVEEQVKALINIGLVFKTGRKGGCDLKAIGGTSLAGALFLSTKVSNWKKLYNHAYIIDSSASGIYESKSIDLFELL